MPKPPKNIAPIHQALVCVYGLWLLYRLAVHVVIVGLSTQADMRYGVIWQMLVLLPALAFVSTIIKATSAYRLILANLLMLIYLAGVGVFFTIRLYENAPIWVKIGLGAEMALLLLINLLLMILIKRLPPMYKNNNHHNNNHDKPYKPSKERS